MTLSTIPAALGGGFLSGDPRQVAHWIATTDPQTLTSIADQLRGIRDRGGTCTRDTASGMINNDPGRGTVPQHVPPLVGARDHVTVSSRLMFQGRGLHLPYICSTATNAPVTTGTWVHPTLHAYDDPYDLASGNGFVINQDGIWTILIKVDWSPTPDEAITGTGRAVRLEGNGADVGVRDFLDDGTDNAADVIDTFCFTDQYQAGTAINVAVRCENLPTSVTLKANVYLRAFLVRCAEGPYDHASFPPPQPDPPVRGTRPPVDYTQPATPSSNGQFNLYYLNGTPAIVHQGGVVYYSKDGHTVKTAPESSFVSNDWLDSITTHPGG